LEAESKPRRVWHFCASAESKPIGVATLVSGAGVSGLYGVEVLENWRNRGIGTALVDVAVRKARDLGFSTTVLSATRLGKGVYERVGFEEVCTLSFWKYGKMRQLG
jgi:GNAT superfamily N-acetyltransferase